MVARVAGVGVGTRLAGVGEVAHVAGVGVHVDRVVYIVTIK